MRTAFTLLLFVGCGSATGPSIPDAEHLTVGSVAVTPGTVTTKRGLDAPTQLSAKATLSNQASVDVTVAATWKSSNAAVATVDAAGLVTPVSGGMATITATYDGVDGTSVVSATNPRIYMSETGSPPAIDVFDTYANGDVAPIQSITGAATTLSFPWQIEVVDDEIYVSDPSSLAISIWPITAMGNVAFTRQIKSPMLQSGYGMAVFNHEIYVAVNNAGVGAILVFPTTASGANVAPTRQITGPSTGLTGGIYGLKIYNNEIYTADLNDQAIQVFPVNANGNVAPARTIKGALTGLGQVESLTVDHGEIFVADLNGIHVFPATGDGNIAPIRVIVGADTGLGTVITAAVVGDELVTANYSSGGIHVHPRNATSNAMPLRNINGAMSSTIKSPRLLTVY